MAHEASIHLTPDEWVLLQRLAELAGLPPDQALHLVVEKGLGGLRLEAAIRLYTTTPISTGEIAERTGLNRGVLLRELQARQVVPYAPPDDTEEREMTARAEQRGRRWRKLARQ